MLIAALAALVATVAVYRFSGGIREGQSGGPAWRPFAVVLLLAAVYATIASVFTINHHHNLGTTIYDLGVYDNIFWQTTHGHLLGTTLIRTGSHAASHFDPILVLLSPLYFISPRAELLLVLQSFWLASTAIPLFLLGRDKLENPWHAVVIAGALLLYPALHGANFYDFHSLSLVAPLFVWAFLFLERGNVRRYGVFLALMLITREDIPLLACFLGLYAILGRRNVRLGAGTIAVSLAYFIAVKLSISAVAGDDVYSFAYYYRDLVPDEDGGVVDLIRAVITHPIFALRVALSPPKLSFLVTMFLPVIFLPLAARRGKVMLLYGLAIILLATRSAVYSVHFQYTSVLYPAIFVLVPVALADIAGNRLVKRSRLDPRRLTRALLAGLAVASVFVSAGFGGLFPNDTFRAGYGRFRPLPTLEGRAKYAWVREAVGKIPREASVSASRHLGPHASNRHSIYRFPTGWGSDYLLLDRAELNRWRRTNLERLEDSGGYEMVSDFAGRLVLMRRVSGVDLPEPVGRR